MHIFFTGPVLARPRGSPELGTVQRQLGVWHPSVGPREAKHPAGASGSPQWPVSVLPMVTAGSGPGCVSPRGLPLPAGELPFCENRRSRAPTFRTKRC